jgi:hypothetical protein
MSWMVTTTLVYIRPARHGGRKPAPLPAPRLRPIAGCSRRSAWFSSLGLGHALVPVPVLLRSHDIEELARAALLPCATVDFSFFSTRFRHRAQIFEAGGSFRKRAARLRNRVRVSETRRASPNPLARFRDGPRVPERARAFPRARARLRNGLRVLASARAFPKPRTRFRNRPLVAQTARASSRRAAGFRSRVPFLESRLAAPPHSRPRRFAPRQTAVKAPGGPHARAPARRRGGRFLSDRASVAGRALPLHLASSRWRRRPFPA